MPEILLRRTDGKCLVKAYPLIEGTGLVSNAKPIICERLFRYGENVETALSDCFRKSKIDKTDLMSFMVKRLHSVPQEGGAGSWSLPLGIDREGCLPAFKLTPPPSTSESFEFPLDEKNKNDLAATVLPQIADRLGGMGRDEKDLSCLLQAMVNFFFTRNATNVHVASIGRAMDSGELVWHDSRCTIDPAAAKKQSELFALRKLGDELPEEAEAARHGLVYVKMEGNIGNVVNGAELAMATSDAISLYGGLSANFLDTGGQATKETMMQAFRTILNDKRVKVILVNIYGGKSIMLRRDDVG